MTLPTLSSSSCKPLQLDRKRREEAVDSICFRSRAKKCRDLRESRAAAKSFTRSLFIIEEESLAWSGRLQECVIFPARFSRSSRGVRLLLFCCLVCPDCIIHLKAFSIFFFFLSYFIFFVCSIAFFLADRHNGRRDDAGGRRRRQRQRLYLPSALHHGRMRQQKEGGKRENRVHESIFVPVCWMRRCNCVVATEGTAPASVAPFLSP